MWVMAVAEPVVVGMRLCRRRGHGADRYGGIQDGLGVGDVVDGGHGAVLDTQLLVDHLHHGRQAVGGTGGRRHYGVLRLVVEVVVDPMTTLRTPSSLTGAVTTTRFTPCAR